MLNNINVSSSVVNSLMSALKTAVSKTTTTDTSVAPVASTIASILPTTTSGAEIQATQNLAMLGSNQSLDDVLKSGLAKLNLNATDLQNAIGAIKNVMAIKNIQITDTSKVKALLNQMSRTVTNIKADPNAKLSKSLDMMNSTTGQLVKSPTPSLNQKMLGGLSNKYVRNFDKKALGLVDDPRKLLLDQDPFMPTDTTMFGPDAYAGNAEYDAPTSSSINPQALMNTTLENRFKNDPTALAKAKAIFTDPAIVSKVPDPRLRASLAMLSGTPGAVAIDAIKNGVYESVEFGTPPSGDAASAEVAILPNGTKKIIFNTKFQYEDPRVLAPILAHETIHQDSQVNSREEMIGDVLTDTTYAQFLREDPTIAQQKTRLVQQRNTFLAAMLNTRDADGRINLSNSRASTIFPGGVDDPLNASYAAAYDLTGPATPGNAVLDSYLSKISKSTVSGANFDDNTVALLNQKLNDYLNPSDWLRVALALKMDVPLTPDLPA